MELIVCPKVVADPSIGGELSAARSSKYLTSLESCLLSLSGAYKDLCGARRQFLGPVQHVRLQLVP